MKPKIVLLQHVLFLQLAPNIENRTMDGDKRRLIDLYTLTIHVYPET